MKYCVDCGVPIPEGQNVCSVCYGDPFYGKDGILLRMMEKDFQEMQAEDKAKDLEEEAVKVHQDDIPF